MLTVTTGRARGTRLRSTLVTASPMPWPRRPASRCCSKAMTSAAQTSPQRLTAAEAHLIGATFATANGPWQQRARRRERDERAFLFDSDLNLIAEFEREDWEWALSSGGGD